MSKKIKRVRRAKRARMKIRELGVSRLTVHRTPRHIYAQVIAPNGNVVASASTLDKDIKSNHPYGGNVKVASEVGKLIASRAKAAGVDKVAFDRSGFKFHGRVAALAMGAREGELEF